LNVVVNAGCKEKDISHMRAHLHSEKWSGKDLRMEVLDRSLIAIQGPKAKIALQAHVGANLANLDFMEAAFMEVPHLNETLLVSRCGYTGEDGFEISVSNKNAVKLCEILLSQKDCDNKYYVKMAGLGARDILRLEAGLCLYGHDINDVTTPMEAKFKWMIGKSRRTNVYNRILMLLGRLPWI